MYNHLLKRRHLLGLGISTAALAACGRLNKASNTDTNAAKLRLGFQPPYVAVFALREQKLLENQPVLSSAACYPSNQSQKPYPPGRSIWVDLGLGRTPIAAIAS